MGIRIENPFNEGMTKLEVAYPEGQESEPTPQTIRELRARAMAYVFNGRTDLTNTQHEAIEEFVTLKKATLGKSKDPWEAVADTPCQVSVSADAVTEFYLLSPIKGAQLTYPQSSDWRNHPMGGQYPGSAAYLIYEFLAI